MNVVDGKQWEVHSKLALSIADQVVESSMNSEGRPSEFGSDIRGVFSSKLGGVLGGSEVSEVEELEDIEEMLGEFEIDEEALSDSKRGL